MSPAGGQNSVPLDLNADAAVDYLARRGYRRDLLRCRDLGGGVSNNVVAVDTGAEKLVLKQALPRLRVRDEWLADRSRIFRERDALIDAARLLPPAWVPAVVWSDEPNYLFAMRAAEEPSEFWKSRLLRGIIEPHLARRAGLALGLTIRGSWRSEALQLKFGDQTAFNQLRIDPYYRTIARRNPDIAELAEEWIATTGSCRAALVQGDWSPKNMLVTPRGLVFIDYECTHFGDPSFDAGFCLNHFLLKAFHQPVWAEGYLGLAEVFFTWTLAVLPPEALADFETATSRHLGFLLLARVDGKSPVEYLTAEAKRDLVRQAAKRIIRERAASLEGCLEVVRQSLKSLQ
jgi:5-methylthioribose kinase